MTGEIHLRVLTPYELVASREGSDLALDVRRHGSRWLVLPSDSLTRARRLRAWACLIVAYERDGFRNGLEDFSEAIEACRALFAIEAESDPALLETLGSTYDEGGEYRGRAALESYYARQAALCWARAAGTNPGHRETIRGLEERALDLETSATRLRARAWARRARRSRHR